MISVSLLSAFIYCRRKVFLERVLNLYEPIKDIVVLGKIRHDCFDRFNKTEQNTILSITPSYSNEEISDLYLNSFSKILKNSIKRHRKQINQFNLNPGEVFKKIWPNMKNESELRSDNIITFITQHKLYGKDLWNILTPKIESEVYITSEKLGIRGIIDHIKIYKDKIIPYEVKSGKPPKEGVWPSHRIQAGAYIMLLQEKHKTNEGFVKYLNPSSERRITLNPFLRDEIINIRDNINNLLSSKEIPDFTANKAKCQSCGLKNYCHNKEFIKNKLNLLNQ